MREPSLIGFHLRQWKAIVIGQFATRVKLCDASFYEVENREQTMAKPIENGD